MRHRSYLLALFLFIVPLTAHAEDVAAPSASSLYAHAVKDLDEGHWFESAISDLTKAVHQDPRSCRFHLALGCAEADRAGSLAYAAYWTDRLLNARADYAAWKAAQKNPAADDYGKPFSGSLPPEAGVHFQTKDDLKPLHLTGKQAATRIIALGEAAQDEWRLAVRLAGTPQERAEAENITGWGLLYEYEILMYTSYPVSKVPHAPEPKDAVAAFTAATHDDPGRAVLWEGLGDAYKAMDEARYSPDIVRTWKRALALAPRNTSLRFRLFELQNGTNQTGQPLDSKGALETLKALAKYNSRSSLVQYNLAWALLRQVHYKNVFEQVRPEKDNQPSTKEELTAWRQTVVNDLAASDDALSRQTADEAIEALERGNAGDDNDRPDDAQSVPKILRHAWNYYHAIDQLVAYPLIKMQGRIRALARAAGGYAVVAAHEGDEDRAKRAARACIGMGLKMAGDWPIREQKLYDEKPLRVLIGIAIASLGYTSLVQVCAELGDDALTKSVAAEREAFTQQTTAYLAARATVAEEEASASDEPWDTY